MRDVVICYVGRSGGVDLWSSRGLRGGFGVRRVAGFEAVSEGEELGELVD